MNAEPSAQEPRRPPAVAAVQEDVDRWRVHRLATRVLIIQVLALAGLWALQSCFGNP